MNEKYEFTYSTQQLKKIRKEINRPFRILLISSLGFSLLGIVGVYVFSLLCDSSHAYDITQLYYTLTILSSCMFCIFLLLAGLLIIVHFFFYSNMSPSELQNEFHQEVKVENNIAYLTLTQNDDIIKAEFPIKRIKKGKQALYLYKNAHYYVAIPSESLKEQER